jgi:hypothetical protein
MNDTTRRVRINIEGLKAYVEDDVDNACHFVGVFARAAREQGWSEDEIEQVVRPTTAKRAYEELTRYIERGASDEPSFSFAHREADYREGCRLLADDPNVRFKPFRWDLRLLSDTIKQGQTDGWFSRPQVKVEPGERHIA